MAPLVMTNCRLWLGGYDLSGYANQLGIEYGTELGDDSTFGGVAVSGTRSNKPTIKTAVINGSVFVDPSAMSGLGTPDSVDEYLFERIAADREVMSVAADGEDADDPVWFMRGVNGSYVPLGGSVGDLLQSELDFRAANSVLVRGWLLKGAGTVITTTGNSSVLNHTGPTAAQKVASALHVIPVAGSTPTLDVVIQSDSVVGMSSPTTQLTHPQFTTSRGASWQQADGPITDAYWQATWTLGGASPQYLVFLTLGIF